MQLVIEKPITVITPTIGSPKLLDAIESVRNQTYNCKHLIVVDGPEHNQKVWAMGVEGIVDTVTTPENTGKVGNQSFYGHRIYAAYPHLINSDYILFLDEDNWYEPNHVETLVNTIEAKDLDFSYSLRKIFSPDKKYLCDDNCESLGKWEIFLSRGSQYGNQYLVDTSSYCFKKQFIQQTCNLWHFGWGGDRRFFSLIKDHAKYDTSGKHTMCYRLDGNENSVSKEFFEEGNKIQSNYYGGRYPWLKI